MSLIRKGKLGFILVPLQMDEPMLLQKEFTDVTSRKAVIAVAWSMDASVSRRRDQ